MARWGWRGMVVIMVVVMMAVVRVRVVRLEEAMARGLVDRVVVTAAALALGQRSSQRRSNGSRGLSPLLEISVYALIAAVATLLAEWQ